MKTKVEKEIIINAPIDKVWKALTNKDDMKHWYFDIPDFNLEKAAVFNFFKNLASRTNFGIVVKLKK
ncbi:SRPBCC domain-containing protein [Soonwooa sp.]|uniref:SRPBCC family protein n=1 Tax=Soonwooa sp. TaxID=1938592 RepID=UPI0028AD5A43|nr:SRPBCC domain-containing protein [Soonwooa sp.]